MNSHVESLRCVCVIIDGGTFLCLIKDIGPSKGITGRDNR